MLIKDFQENYDAGWIKIYRSLTDHWIWEKPLSKFEAWVDMILEANYKEEKVLIDSFIHPVGSFCNIKNFSCLSAIDLVSFFLISRRYSTHSFQVSKESLLPKSSK